MEEIKGFDNLISVRTIYLDNNKNLKTIPSFEKLKRIKNLFLYILDENHFLQRQNSQTYDVYFNDQVLEACE